MNIRPTVLLLALALAFQPLAAQESRPQAVRSSAAQSSNGGDEDREGSDKLVPLVVGPGIVAGAVAAGMMGGDAAPAAAARDEGVTYVPGASMPDADPVGVTSGTTTSNQVAVPEPGMLGLMAMGVLGLMGVAVWRRRGVTA